MTAKRKNINSIRRISTVPIPAYDTRATDLVLAKLVARAYALDHPDLFGMYIKSTIGGAENGKNK